MDRIRGLREYVERSEYKEMLKIPYSAKLEYKILAQGEYNINYIFIHPVTKEKLLLRINTGSQMHLEDQIGYEYKALKLLESSKRTPKAIYVDGSLKNLDNGVLVMGFLEGRALDYKKDLDIAAECLADIHSLKLERTHLVSPQDPLAAIINECRDMFDKYKNSSLADKHKILMVENMLLEGEAKVAKLKNYSGYKCCVNTELNSSNFLINGSEKQNYIIDWEKPILGDPAQDLGHFLAPTTTFWKTDNILDEKEIMHFINKYKSAVRGSFDIEDLEERVNIYIPINCLRGLTWCAMALNQYQGEDRLIKNEDTLKKLNQYMSEDFLNMIKIRFFY